MLLARNSRVQRVKPSVRNTLYMKRGECRLELMCREKWNRFLAINGPFMAAFRNRRKTDKPKGWLALRSPMKHGETGGRPAARIGKERVCRFSALICAPAPTLELLSFPFGTRP